MAMVLNSADGEQFMANGLVDDYHRLDSCGLLQIVIPSRWQAAEYVGEYTSWIALQVASVAY